MRLVDSICIVVAELVNNSGNTVMVAFRQSGSDCCLEFKGTALSLIVQLILQRSGCGVLHLFFDSKRFVFSPAVSSPL